MNPIAQAVVAAYEAARAMTGEAVTYTALEWGDALPIELTVVPGRSAFEATNDAGIVESQTQDWLVLTSEMGVRLHSPSETLTRVIPERGDLLKDSDGRYWKVLSDGSAPWRFNDQYRVVMRIHTKLVDDCEISEEVEA